ncbi:MAG: GTPase HflX [Sandaracinaceae bacterium]|nr:GTPase HflX [Sandaracinaceae bacterium]
MTRETTDPRTASPRAVLVGVQLPGVTDAEHQSSLDELARLAKTLGLTPIARVTQKRKALARAAVLGEGKLAELARHTGGTGIVPSFSKKKAASEDEAESLDEVDEVDEEVDEEVDDAPGDDAPGDEAPLHPEALATLVVVDHELSPSQARNLEKATGVEVADRTSVILQIFQRHARTREARLQVEIARLAYDAPRLREASGGADRQRGGIGGKGAGESTLELDRRRIRDRIAELRRELAGISREDAVRRARRVERGDTVALVGYTNAGKSSWFRRLTQGDVYVADELFATLDTTVRRLSPETRPPILVSDTVGFIKKLPHDLVASFRSTLDEAREASLLVHVVDVADPAWREQLAVTREVLAELGVHVRVWSERDAPTGAARRDEGERPCLVLLNKLDRLDEDAQAAIRAELPDAMLVSARDDASLAAVRARIVAFFEASMDEAQLFVPWARHGAVSAMRKSARVLEEEHDEAGTRLRVRAPAAVLARLRAQLEG